MQKYVVKMTSYLSRVGPKSNVTGAIIDGHIKTQKNRENAGSGME